MVRVYGYNETLSIMRGAAKYITKECQVYGVSRSGMQWNPYVTVFDTTTEWSPVGMVLQWMGANPFAIEAISQDHIDNCTEAQEDCHICDPRRGNGDTSLYSAWVQDLLAEDYDISFTEEAMDLLWEAETSGQPLWEWLLDGNPKRPEEAPF